MGGFFSVRVAPGVRLSASGRGLRTHLGPRGARLHVGGGRTGVSTGAGPFTYYQGIGGRKGAHSSTSRPVRNGSDKEQVAKLIAAQLERISDLHRQSFAETTKRMPVRPKLPPFSKLLVLSEHHELKGTRLRDRAARSEARSRARLATERYAGDLLARANAEIAQQQAAIDAEWQKLLDNDEDTVLELLEKAFADNEAPVGAVGVHGSEVSLVVQVPGSGAVPDRLPKTTAAGNLSLAKMSKSDTSAWHATLVAAHVIITAKEAFAVCPGLTSARVVAVTEPGLFGRGVVPIMATRLARASLDTVPWSTASSSDVIARLGTETLINMKGRSRELAPLDLRDEPSLRELVASVDVA